jgi:hypothetical protein
VNSATSASTSRFTRYAREKRAVASTHARRQQRLEPALRHGDVGTGAQPKVDARDAPAAIEVVLDRSNVHHRVTQSAVGACMSGNAQRKVVQSRLRDHAIADVNTQPLRGRRAGKKRVAAQRVEASTGCVVPPRLRLRRCAAPGGGAIRALGRPGGAHGNERGIDRRCAKHIDAEDGKRLVTIAQLHVDFDDGTGDRDVAIARKRRIQHLVEAGARAAHFEIRIARQQREARRQFADRGPIDEIDRVAECYAERDGHDGDERAAAKRRTHAAGHRTRNREASGDRHSKSAGEAACNPPAVSR